MSLSKYVCITHGSIETVKLYIIYDDSLAGWPLVMEIMEIMEKSWNFLWSWKKSWNSKNLPNSHGKVTEVFYKDYSFFLIIVMLFKFI